MKPFLKRQSDLQRVRPVGECTRCGVELYPGGDCWRIGGQVLCGDCVAEWIREELAPFRVKLEEVER